MLKILVFHLFLLLSGSKQDLSPKLDSQKIYDHDSLKRPCSPQHTLRIFTTDKQGNDTAIKLPGYVERKNEKLPIVLDCLVKINEETATETVTGGNVSDRKTSDIHYLKFRDVTSKNNRSKVKEEPTLHIDVTEKCTKIPPAELEKKDLESGRRFNQPGHSSEYTYNAHNLNIKPNLDLISTDNQDKIPKEYNQGFGIKKVTYATSTTKSNLTSMKDNRNTPTEYDQFLDSKEVKSKSTPKYLSSTTLHSKKVPKDMLQYLDIGNNGVTNKPSASKYNLSFPLNTSKLFTETDQNLINKEVNYNPSTSTLYDANASSTLNDDYKDSFLYKYLDFSNREVSDKPSVVKYTDLKSKHKNKVIEMPLQDYRYRKDNDKPSTKKHELSSMPSADFDKDLVMYHDPQNKAASDIHSVEKYNLNPIQNNNKISKEHNLTSSTIKDNVDKPSTIKIDQISTPYDDTYKGLFLHKNLGNEKESNELFSKSYDQTLKPNGEVYENLFSSHDSSETPSAKEYGAKSILSINDISKENNKGISNMQVNDKPSPKLDKSSTPYDDIFKDLSLYHDLGNKEENDNSTSKKYESILKYNISLKPLQGNSYKGVSYKHSTKDYEQMYTSYDQIIKYLLLNHDLIDKEPNDTSPAKEYYLRYLLDKIKYSKDNNGGLSYKKVGVKSSDVKNDHSVEPIDGIYKDLYLYHDLNNLKPNDRLSAKIYKQTYMPKDEIYKNLFLYRDLVDSKESNDKSSSNKYDLNYMLSKLKTSNVNNGGLSYEALSDKPSPQKYDSSSTLDEDIYKKLFLYHDLGDLGDLGDKEPSDKYPSGKYNLNSIFKSIQFSKDHNGELKYKKAGSKDDDEDYKNIFLYHDLGTMEASDEDYNKNHHPKSMLNNTKFSNNYQQYLSYSDEKPANNEPDERSALNIDITTNHYLYKDVTGHKEDSNKITNKKYDLKFTLNNKVLGEYDKALNNKKINYKNTTQEPHFNKSSKDELQTSVDITEPHLVEPTTGYSIKDLFKARVMLLESTRVCYACSSISDNSCWQPGRSTTVKYCRKGHNACLTKTFKTEESEFIVIRDCGESCDGTWPVLDPKYKSCSICNEDMCNDHLVDINSGTINRFHFIFFVSITVITKLIF